ncbi:MAG: hypothetical protein HY431_01620 [Candidatus Levybacteria bacterium]|nr:hypothetical protein [Candidatus Levybacteria bacterium]
MTSATIKREQDGTVILTITIPAAEVKKAQEAVMESVVKNAALPGFRKGKAPKKLVEGSVNPQKLSEETLKQLLPQAYMEAVKTHSLRPVMNPKIHVEKLEDPSTHSAGSGQASSGQGGRDWVFTATTAEMPQMTLGDYKKAIRGVTAKSKIVIPGKEQKEPSMDEIMKAFLQEVDVTLPKVLIDQEADRLLAQTLDEIKRLGLTLDQYLSSTGKTPEQLRAEYETKATTEMKFEFALQKVAETEKITISEKEIEEALQKAKDPQERANLEQNRYLLASILRQQKTLDFLRSL